MAQSTINPWFWRHAYMLEFREVDDNGNSKKSEAFTFSLPPESEQISLAQRVNYTKTFGGVVVDDYGNDVFKINLSGTTGNSELKTIFRGIKQFPKVLSGEDEILYLAKLIEKYGQIDKLENKAIYLYDLSKTTVKELISTPNYWQVNIDNFRYQRDKANPTFYKYSLELTGYRPRQLFWFKTQGKYGNEIALTGINTAINVINQIFGTYSGVGDLCSIFLEDIASFASVYDDYKNLIKGKYESVSNVVTEVIQLGEWIKDSENDDSDETTVDSNNTNANFKYWLDKIKEAFENLKNKVSNEVENSNDETVQNIVIQQGLTSRDEFETLIFALLDDIQNKINELNAQVKQLFKIAYYKGYVYYGKKEIIPLSTDTYESISLREFGTIQYADEIAIFNDGVEITAGNKIVVPLMTEQETISGNEVYKDFEDTDEYGKDIALDENGDIVVNQCNGDISYVENDENINQAVLSRISTEMGSRIRDTAYGIKSTVGSTNAVTAFLYASIFESVVRDPRIEDVDSIEFKGVGDKLYYTINYATKLGENVVIQGGI